MGKAIIVMLRLVAALSMLAPLAAHAAGLGRLAVFSALGQPLYAEIEIVSLQAGEDESLSARLAAPEAFRQAGIELTPALIGLQFSIERRNGRPVLRMRSTQPVNEPFLDLLVELQWSTGRLVREYTFLLDPPGHKGSPPIAAEPAPAVQPAPAPTAPAARPETRASAPLPAATHEVKKGDTLGAIARKNKPEGVTLNQMLIALYRANESAFIRGNINLVRTGRILNLPERDAVAGVDPAEASRLVQSQMAEFAEYRRMLGALVATAPAAEGREREVAGRIAPQTEKPVPAEPKDQVQLARADPAKPGAPASRAAREDDRIARERALKEAQSRVGDLEKNVTDLQKLLEMKSQQLAELEKKAQEKPAPAAKAPEAAPEPAAVKPAEKAPAAAAPAPPKAKPKPAAPAPERGLIEELADDPILLGGLGGVAVLLAGYGAWAWRRKKAAQTRFQDRVLGAAAAAPSVAVPEAAPPPAPAAVAVAGEAAAEELDAIPEAEVYMQYGRDAQAEEILKEALTRDPSRAALHGKLLEIYAGRRDAAAFEQAALKLKALAEGSAEWDKAAALGRSVDPGNPLYGEGPAAAGVAPAAAVPSLDFDIGGGAELAAAAGEAKSDALDFDLGAPPAKEKTGFAPGGTLIMDITPAAAEESTTLDFDLGAGEEKKEAAVDVDKTVVTPAAKPAAADPDATLAVDFDLDFDLGAPKAPAAASVDDKPLDLGAINLDLSAAPAAAPAGGGEAKWQEIATKLDLAKAYEEMGDKEGARELLNEVIAEGDAAQQSRARQMLAGLS